MKRLLTGITFLAGTWLPSIAFGLPPADADPNGIVIKPLPDKLVALTFDDGPASHATIVAPILRSLGFGGSFYVCDFDSFRTRKDWYMTWRQMKALADAGFEIGNHTKGHAGGASIGPFLDMEDELLANNVPKPTTVCWPLYQVNTGTYRDLAANGYIFGRGGHDRAYRPTVDNPFDVPSFSVGDSVSVETFINYVRQARHGRVVVITFHGVPDMEHAAVGLNPATFKVMMQYLKDDHYQGIALRDLARYINPARAAKLPPTSDKSSEPSGSSLTAVKAETAKPTVKAQNATGNKTPASAAKEILSFATNSAIAALPQINRTSGGGATITAPVKLVSDLTVTAVERGEVTFGGLISGTGSLIKDGSGTLRITNVINTYSGGTMINGGTLYLFVASGGLGTGPVTLKDGADLWLEHVDGTNPLVLSGGTIDAGNGFGDSWNGPITLHGNTKFAAYAGFHLNNIRGGMSGPGGFTQIGPQGGFGRVNSGWVFLWGTNTYAGPTTVCQGTLLVKKAASLYNADPAKWTAAKISVHPAATLVISAGGKGEFTGTQVGTLLENLTTGVNHNGLMAGSVFSLDTASGTVTVSAHIADSKGPGGGAFLIKKFGAGTLQLCGNNTYSGQTILEAGTLSVSSLNSVLKGKASSSLGAPTNVEAGEILMGSGDGECTLIYTGTGETSDRVINLTGKNSTVTFDQSGTGLVKLTSTFVLSGYGANKTIVLKGDTAGSGEIAGNIGNPYDRAGKATTALTKRGSGVWTLSGVNSFSGPTAVAKGTLSLASVRSLGPKTDVILESGATLDLDFKGRMNVRSLSLGGKKLPPGVYDAARLPHVIRGKGVLNVQP